MVAVLHTWGQNLHHHPHIHCVVPGGGLSPDNQRWVACRPGFFLPVRVLSRLFRRLFLEHLQDAFETGELRFFGKLAGLAASFGHYLWRDEADVGVRTRATRGKSQTKESAITGV
uniref:Transposase IS801/IS1294 domain-containing protein n=1 Tax=Caulobacter sp. (strain K31) TaxID=366602 RepID=B0T9Y8_CAUSK